MRLRICVLSVGLGEEKQENTVLLENSAEISLNNGDVTIKENSAYIINETGEKTSNTISVAGDNSLTIGGTGVSTASNISPTPTDGNGNNVYVAKLTNKNGINEVTVDGSKIFARAGNHSDGDTTFYLYLTGKEHDLTTFNGTYKAK